MNRLKLFLLQTEQSWTLKSDREYIVGSDRDCQIPIPNSALVSARQLKFGFDTVEDFWYAEALGNNNTLIENKPLTRNLIRGETRITLAANIVLLATPEEAHQVSTSPSLETSSSPNSARSYYSEYSQSATPEEARSVISRPSLQTSSAPRNLRSDRSTYSRLENQEDRIINLGFKWFKISSPDDGVGLILNSFRLAQTYHIDCEKIHQIGDKLYEQVLAKVEAGSISDAKIRTFVYNKSGDNRRFIRISRDTVHGIRTTIFIRFLSYGDNLYLGLDVYVLGDFNWLQFLIFKALPTSILLLFSFL
jgi:hypothetical protein